jgi:hypothetical protein
MYINFLHDGLFSKYLMKSSLNFVLSKNWNEQKKAKIKFA